MDITNFFTLNKKDKAYIFTGDKLDIFIPQRYKAAKRFTITSTISTVGILAMRINDKIDCGIRLPVMIQIDPTETYNTTINDEAYIVCRLEKGDKFMVTNDVIRDDKILHFMWSEFLALGHLPTFITHENITTLFDDLKVVAGINLPVDHALLEIVYAHIYRDANDKTKFYRHTDMKNPPVTVTLRDVAYGPSSTHGKIIGSYADEGRTSALLNQAESSDTLEDFFRS